MKKNIELQISDASVSEAVTDADLEIKANAALHAHCRLHSEKISAHVSDRSVYLEGAVPSQDEREMAQQCVENIFGVRSVYNNITFPSRLTTGSL